MSKYYISQTVVEFVDGRLTGREVVLTRADAKVDKDGARLQNVKMFMHKLKALGIPNLHVNKYEKNFELTETHQLEFQKREFKKIEIKKNLKNLEI